MNDSMRFFFIVGAQRSGTTYLYKVLDSHPDIMMAKPMRPEPKFFLNDDLYLKGEEYYFYAYFRETKNTIVYGEKSASYLEKETAAFRIHQYFPDSKIVILLRNPITRAISNYWFTKNHGHEPLSISDAFYNEDGRVDQYDPKKFSVSPYAYLKRGRYMDYIEIYARYFHKRQIKVLIFEEFLGNPKPGTLAICEFLGMDYKIPASILNNVINPGNHENSELPPELLAYMQRFFRQSNLELEQYLGRKIPW
ncbi:MAG: sulfotransferase [Anaerolineales bacterium]|nr:sulfotransferase [Anaerolineales bacterium]